MNTKRSGPVVSGKEYKKAYFGSEYMLFILPNEGITSESIVSNKNTLEEALYSTFKKSTYYDITFNIPKFNYGPSLNLNSSLKKLGINSAFDTTADFSNLTRFSQHWITNVSQNTYIAVDENGCEAVSCTELSLWALHKLKATSI